MGGGLGVGRRVRAKITGGRGRSSPRSCNALVPVRSADDGVARVGDVVSGGGGKEWAPVPTFFRRRTVSSFPVSRNHRAHAGRKTQERDHGFGTVVVPRAPQLKRSALEAVRDEAGEFGCEVSCHRAGREAHGATPPLEATCEQHETAEPCLSEAFRLWARAAVVFSLPVADVGDTSARFHASSV